MYPKTSIAAAIYMITAITHPTFMWPRVNMMWSFSRLSPAVLLVR